MNLKLKKQVESERVGSSKLSKGIIFCNATVERNGEIFKKKMHICRW